MKFLSATAFALCLFVLCGSQTIVRAADEPTPAKPETSPAPEAAKPDGTAPPPAVDFGDFGSDDPVERADMPTRGLLSFPSKDGVMNMMDHWAQYDWKFTAKRSGHYLVRMNYHLDHASLGIQFKLGETRLRKTLTAAPVSRRTYLGEIFIAEPSEQTFAVYVPSSANSAGFDLLGVDLVPTIEGESSIAQAKDGGVILHAKNATTWSETMRYESKPEKNCLGYWTDPEDFAEWEFQLSKPGRYQVVVTQGCGGGNAGSEVAVKVAGQELKFTVKDTGGFQKWEDVNVGEVEIKEPGVQRVVVDPLNKKKSAVLDVQKVQLKPVS